MPATFVGTLDSVAYALVGAHGSVRSWPDVFALEWWIGADDRWRIAEREAAVRQRLIDGAPVVESTMRIPGGDAVQRVYACRAGSAGDVVVVEVENASPVPVALALAVRGIPATRHRVDVDGATVLVDGRVAAWLPHPPPRAACAAPGAVPDLETTVTSGAATSSLPTAMRRSSTDAAFVFPLAHRTAVRIVLPLARHRPRRSPTAPAAASLPGAASVAHGWAAHRASMAQFDIPMGRLADAITANQSYALAAAVRAATHDGVTRAVERRLATASPTWTWAGADGAPEGDPDPAAVGEFLAAAAALFVAPTAEGVALVPGWRPEWTGQPVTVSRVPAGRGTVSCAVRWHGDRPALLWEIDGTGPVRVTAPGLDPEWSSAERRGEALLGPFARGTVGAGDSAP